MDDHCEEFTQKHLRMLMKELSQVKNDADEKEQELQDLNRKLRLQRRNHEELESKFKTRIRKLETATPITDELEKKIGEVAERCFGFIKLLSQIITNYHDVQSGDNEEDEINEFVSSVVELKEDEKDNEPNVDTCFKILDKEYVFPEIDALSEGLPQELKKKNYQEKLNDLLNAMENDRFYEFGDEEIYVKVNLHDFAIPGPLSLYLQYHSKITSNNERYCVHSNETISFTTGSFYSSLFLYHHDDSGEERKWFYNHVNGDNDIPTEKDITEVQFIHFGENGRTAFKMETVVRWTRKYWHVGIQDLLIKHKSGDQYAFLCFKKKIISDKFIP